MDLRSIFQAIVEQEALRLPEKRLPRRRADRAVRRMLELGRSIASAWTSRLRANCSMKAIASDGLFVLDALSRFHGVFPVIRPKQPYSQAVLNRLAEDDCHRSRDLGFRGCKQHLRFLQQTKRITERQIREYLDLLKALPIRVESQSMPENIDLESLSPAGTSRRTTRRIFTWRGAQTFPSPLPTALCATRRLPRALW